MINFCVTADFILDMSNDNPSVHAIKAMASKVLFALSVNFFNAVFSRISTKLQELASCPDENPDYSDIELIQHINVDVTRLTKLLTGTKTGSVRFASNLNSLIRSHPEV